MLKSFIYALAGLAIGGAASAATIDYTNSQTNPGGPALSCDAFGLLNASCSITYNQAGLGVKGSPDFQPGQIDGSPIGSSERLTFDFGKDTIWNSITFGRWDNNDDALLTFGNGDTLTYGPGIGATTLALGGVISQTLSVTAKGVFWHDGFGNDSFTVASIDVAPVPLPAAGWMLIAGLGGIAAARRRRTRN
ncbi:VPLPA-CTERM protein sorting domain protein [Jannaschia seosinensis]|uniref:VPLPA-CTERM protein sorting domain protein n=1 Tax=Jannaschia seosinensis TaxID=313367 RepID=A0A0M7BGI2_9RHOB|nr:VPLPA-CTERM sorting domain-containing protein [Jannaschia seosinensis]CUH41013.1 VPLPA-CTERM protein sorting domain protein [Jannaschia seosinensis]